MKRIYITSALLIALMGLVVICNTPVRAQSIAAQFPPPLCYEIDETNTRPFNVGDYVFYGVIGESVGRDNGRGFVTRIDMEFGLIFVRPDGNPHAQAIHKEELDCFYSGKCVPLALQEVMGINAPHDTPRLRELKASYPGDMCASGPGLGSELGFELARNPLKHVRRAQ